MAANLDSVFIVEATPRENAVVFRRAHLERNFKQVVQLLANAYEPKFYRANPFLKGVLPKRKNLAHPLSKVFQVEDNWYWLLDYAFYHYQVLLSWEQGNFMPQLKQLALMKSFPPAFVAGREVVEISSLLPTERQRASVEQADYRTYDLLQRPTPSWLSI